MTRLNGHRRALATDLDAAFPTFVHASQDGLYGGLLRLTRDPQLAADAAQDTYIRAYRALSDYQPERIRTLEVAGWLWTIALNVVRNEARRTRRKPVLLLDQLPETTADTPGPEDHALERASLVQVAAALDHLSETGRQSVVLRHVVGLSYREIAEATGRPINTIKSDVRRGLRSLAEHMGDSHD